MTGMYKAGHSECCEAFSCHAGMRGIASSSMTSLDGKGATSSYRDREAAAKARASLDFSSLSERAAKGTRPLPHQRAKSADIPANSQHKHHQVRVRCLRVF